MTRRYEKAPVVEGLISLTFRSPLFPGEVRRIVEAVKEHYPSQKPLRSFNVHFDMNTEEGSVKLTELGTRLSNSKETEVLVIHPESLTVSRLSPYSGWPDLTSRLRDALAPIIETSGFRPLSRVGIRYINRLDVPMSEDSVPLEDFVNIGTAMPSQYLDRIGVWASRTELNTDEPDCVVILNAGSIVSPVEDHGSILLDIDVVKKAAAPETEEGLWKFLSRAREIKNEIFESIITDNTRKLIQ